jgi:hypothetical protein
MRKVAITQTATATWAASSTLRTSLEREGVITRVEFTAEITPNSTLAAANQPGALYRAMLNHRILGGGHTFMELPNTGESGNAGQLMHYLNAIDHGGMPGFPDQQSISGPDQTYHPVTWVFHCGARPRDMYGRDNPFDLSGLIPAFQVTDLVAEWITTVNTILDDTVTISSGTGRYTIYYVIGTHEEIVQEMRRQQVMLPHFPDKPGVTAMMPAWVSETFAIDSTYSDYSLSRNVPVGRYLKRIGIASQDATGSNGALLANDEVTGAKLSVRLQDVIKVYADAQQAKLPKGNFFVADDAVELGAGGHPKGILALDLRPYGHPDYGLNLTRGEAGQVGGTQLGLTVSNQSSGDDALFLYEGYIPYEGALGY